MSIDDLRDLPLSFFRLNNLRKFGLSDNEIQRLSRVDRVIIGCSVLSIHWLHQLCQKIPVAVVAPVALHCNWGPLGTFSNPYCKGGSKVPNFLVRGGWVGSDVWDKVPNKSVFLTPSLKVVRTADRHHVDYGPSAGPGLGAHRLEELLLPCHRHRPLLPLP